MTFAVFSNEFRRSEAFFSEKMNHKGFVGTHGTFRISKANISTIILWNIEWKARIASLRFGGGICTFFITWYSDLSLCIKAFPFPDRCLLFPCKVSNCLSSFALFCYFFLNLKSSSKSKTVAFDWKSPLYKKLQRITRMKID